MSLVIRKNNFHIYSVCWLTKWFVFCAHGFLFFFFFFFFFFVVKSLDKMKVLVVIAALLALTSATDKGMSMMPYNVPSYSYPQMSYGPPVSYAPVYEAQAVDSYAYDLPQYKSYNNFKTYMPVVKYVEVQSVPYMGPTQAFYPKSYGGGGYGGYRK